MELLLISLNHRSAELGLREKFAIASERQSEFLNRCLSLPHVEEALLLSTCNRVEIYAVSRHPVLARQQLTRLLAEFQNLDASLIEKHLDFYFNKDAVLQGFKVAASLDSMVIGETQILGQVKEAYRLASESKATGTLLNKFFHRAFHAAKKVRSDTGIGSNPVSISYAALVLARQIFGKLDEKKLLVLGAGKMSELALRHFKQEGMEKLFIANRSSERATELADKVGGEAIPFDKFEKWLADADVVLTSTAANDFLIKAQAVQEAMRTRKNRPMFLIDIAVPRNISPEVNGLPNVYLYNIDDLGAVVEANKAERLQEAEHALVLLEREVEEFMKFLKTLELVPTISSLSNKWENICRHELEKTFQKLPQLDPEARETITKLAYAITNKILHDPMVTLKQQDPEQAQLDYSTMLRKLFRLDEA